MKGERISSLREVAEAAMEAGELSYALRDFLDGFYGEPSAEKIVGEPRLISGALKDDGLADAWLAATAEFLARRSGFPIPEWVFGDARTLRFPHFAARTHGLRMICLQESPVPFRRRNIFVTANALSRV